MIEDPAEATTIEPEPRKARGRAPGLAILAAIVAIVALAVAAGSVWRLQRFTHAEEAARKQDAATIANLQSQLAAGTQQAQAGNHRLGNLASGLDDLRTGTQGLGRRIANLETAITNLSGQQQSGHDTMLLNDAEMLLRTGQQRYDLFHDSTGALKAYSQAIEVLAQVQNPAYAPVRASLAPGRAGHAVATARQGRIAAAHRGGPARIGIIRKAGVLVARRAHVRRHRQGHARQRDRRATRRRALRAAGAGPGPCAGAGSAAGIRRGGVPQRLAARR